MTSPILRSELPPLPLWKIVVVEDRTATTPAEQAFMHTRQLVLRAVMPDGTESEPFTYSVAERARLDAVVIVPHFLDADGERCVVLRSAVRPPLALRPEEARPVPEKPTLGCLWELPAGLVEPDERSEAGLRACAARELHEEIGISVDPAQVIPLGPSTFPMPGAIAERHFFFRAAIEPSAMQVPVEDGSVLERQASIVALRLSTALELCRTGVIEDAKTELALRRLAET